MLGVVPVVVSSSDAARAKDCLARVLSAPHNPERIASSLANSLSLRPHTLYQRCLGFTRCRSGEKQ